MNKINKELAILIVFLILIVLAGTFVKTPVDTKMPVKELKVAGFFIGFEDGVSESEVQTILESYNLTMNYSIKYNIDHVADKYYIMLDKDSWDIRREMNKKMKEEKKDWIVSSPSQVIRKGDYQVFTVSQEAIHDENFLAILNKYNIQVKKFFWCSIRFEKPDGSRYWIPEKDAIRTKSKLEMNESIFSANIEYTYDQ